MTQSICSVAVCYGKYDMLRKNKLRVRSFRHRTVCMPTERQLQGREKTCSNIWIYRISMYTFGLHSVFRMTWQTFAKQAKSKTFRRFVQPIPVTTRTWLKRGNDRIEKQNARRKNGDGCRSKLTLFNYIDLFACRNVVRLFPPFIISFTLLPFALLTQLFGNFSKGKNNDRDTCNEYRSYFFFFPFFNQFSTQQTVLYLNWSTVNIFL